MEFARPSAAASTNYASYRREAFGVGTSCISEGCRLPTTGHMSSSAPATTPALHLSISEFVFYGGDLGKRCPDPTFRISA